MHEKIGILINDTNIFVCRFFSNGIPYPLNFIKYHFCFSRFAIFSCLRKNLSLSKVEFAILSLNVIYR